MAEKKTVSVIMMSLLILGMGALAFYIQPVWAIGTIYIMADGTVSPSTAPILRNGNYYTLTGNIMSSGYGIIVQKSFVIIDGAGHTLNGSGQSANGIGFNLTGVGMLTIKNTIITNFLFGIWLDSSSSGTFSGNNITNDGVGIVVDDYSNFNTFSGNNITSGYGDGIYLGGGGVGVTRFGATT